MARVTAPPDRPTTARCVASVLPAGALAVAPPRTPDADGAHNLLVARGPADESEQHVPVP